MSEAAGSLGMSSTRLGGSPSAAPWSGIGTRFVIYSLVAEGDEFSAEAGQEGAG